MVNNYFDTETINAQGQFSRYDTQSTMMDQVNAALGQPGDGSSLSSKLDDLYDALGQASLDPGLQANQQSVFNQFQSVAQSVSDLSGSIASLRNTADQQLGVAAASANSLIKQIYDINTNIQYAETGGDKSSGLLDQRDQLVQQLSQLVGVRTVEQPDGRMFVSTLDGVSLVGDTYSQINYQPSNGPSYNPLTIQDVNVNTGTPIGSAKAFDADTGAGSMRGLLDMRDGTLEQLAEELGSFAQGLQTAYNAQHNANTAVPPPATMDGRNTGLLSTDALNFSGTTTIGLADSSGTLQHSVVVDFDAGTVSVDGGSTASIGTTVGSFATALNTAMASVGGSASFADGALSLAAPNNQGLVVSDDASDPTSRGGVPFSQFFGLNDLFQSDASGIQTTGLTTADTGGFAPGGQIKLLLKGPDGERVNETTVNVTGSTIGDMISALNTAFAGNASFALDSNGKLNVTMSSAYQNYDLEVTSDTTQRGTTGDSFSKLFGLGTGQTIAFAQNFQLANDVATSPQRLAFAQASLDSTTALGTQIAGPGDNRGLLALQNLNGAQIPFSAAGAIPGTTTSLNDYAATFYQYIATRGQNIDAYRSAQSTRLQQAQENQSQSEGVNLDEELSKMMQLQQAYNAGTRLIQVAQDLFDQLLNAV
jgi:flagellar hook-associated protein 1 FlgK